MANFNTHLSVGFFISSVVSVTLYKADILDSHALIYCTILGTAGGLLPDIDSKNSTPTKIFFNLLSMITAFFLVIYFKEAFPLLLLIMIWGAGFVFIRYLVFELFTDITVHRGVIHSVPFMAMLALGLVYFSYYALQLTSLNSWLYGIFLFLGSMVHLILDEIYSVNLYDMTVKRSFGTAFKFYKHQYAFHFLFLYIFLGLLVFYAPPFLDFWEKLTNYQLWIELKNDII